MKKTMIDAYNAYVLEQLRLAVPPRRVRRLNLRSLNLRSRRRFDRWFRLEVTGHYHRIGIASTWDRGSPVWPADYRLIYLATLNEESSPDGR